jgi:L-histidine N-alpha-methyltransferase
MIEGGRYELLGGSGVATNAGAALAMAREVRVTLSRKPRSIPPKYFYDEAGSRLFDAICDLPEYYLTRAEHALLERHAAAIVEQSRASTLVEIGSGMARKTGLLVRAVCAQTVSPLYVPFDIAPSAIEASARALLAAFPRLRVRGVVGDFARDCSTLALGAPPGQAPRLFALLGSTVGNLDEREAPALVRALAGLMAPRDRFLLGVDLVKDQGVLHAAYNDAQGVTAAFNKNVLRVLARELDGAIDLGSFDHLAFYDAERERIEMHLVSTRAQTIDLRAAALRFDLERGERVMTEISRKFTRATVERTLSEGGMALVDWMAGEDGAFALCLARRA